MQGGSTVTREGWVVLECVRGVLEAQKVPPPSEEGTTLKDFHSLARTKTVLYVPSSIDSRHTSLMP